MIKLPNSLNAGEQGKGGSLGQQISSAISISSISTLDTLCSLRLKSVISGKKYNMTGRPGGSGLDDGLIA